MDYLELLQPLWIEGREQNKKACGKKKKRGCVKPWRDSHHLGATFMLGTAGPPAVPWDGDA